MEKNKKTSAGIINMEQRFKTPNGWTETYFKNARGRQVRYGYVFPDDAKGLISINLGLSEFCEKYFELINELTALGYATSIHDWMGQGMSDRYLPNQHKRHVGTFEDDVDDYFDLMDNHILPKSKKQYGDSFPRMILAHSMGAHITLKALIQRPDFVKSVFLSAPLTRIKAIAPLPDPMALALLKTLKTYAHRSYCLGGDWKKGQRKLLSHDKARNALTDEWFETNKCLQIGAPTVGWVHEAILSCRQLRAADTSHITIPFHVALAGKDILVDNASTKDVLDKLPNATYDEYPKAYHEILIEEDNIRTPVMRSLKTFVEKTLTL